MPETSRLFRSSRAFAAVSLLASGVFAFPKLPHAQATPLDSLRSLIGVWDTQDTYHPETGAPSVESGVRTCALVMNDSYVQCETIAQRANGRSRAYRFLINYNRDSARYEMLSIWSNIPLKLVQKLMPLDQNRRWRVTNLALVGAPLEPHWSEIVFERPDRIVWTGRRVRDGTPPESSPVSFVETWTRRARSR
jgi:hypothetical protein